MYDKSSPMMCPSSSWTANRVIVYYIGYPELLLEYINQNIRTITRQIPPPVTT